MALILHSLKVVLHFFSYIVQCLFSFPNPMKQNMEMLQRDLGNRELTSCCVPNTDNRICWRRGHLEVGQPPHLGLCVPLPRGKKLPKFVEAHGQKGMAGVRRVQKT